MVYEDADIKQLKEKIRELDVTIKQLGTAVNEAMKELGSIHKQKKEVKQRFRTMVDEKRKILESYKKLKSDLKACYASRGALIKQLKAVEKEMEYPKGGISIDAIKERIKNIEWTIHTSILKPSEERRLFLESKKLEEVAALIEKRDSIITCIKAQDEKIKSIEEELDVIENTLRSINEEISKLKDEYEKLKNDSDEKHKNCTQLREGLNRAEAERILLQSKLTTLIERVKRAMDDVAKQREEEFKKRAIAEARQKLLQGKKLTFQELKLLLENDDDFKL
ncbi:MAG: hypothetical protein QXO01_06605 [Nitrososphaerota archaeon]